MVPTSADRIIAFFGFVGIKAEVQLDELKEPIIVISTAQFDEKRAWIELWFTPIVQVETITYLRERPRGTGDTR